MKTFTLEEAQQQLGELINLAGQGESIAIIKDSKLWFLRESPPFEPIPMAPPGFFNDIYDEESIRECNESGKRSVTTPPADLE